MPQASPQTENTKLAELARPSARVAVRDAATAGVAWASATVLDCDEAANAYLVQLAGSGGGGEARQQQQQQDEQGASGSSGAPYWAPRIAVCFGAEDPALYAKRYAAAHAARGAAEALMSYELALDCMPTEGMPQLTTEQVWALAIFISCLLVTTIAFKSGPSQGHNAH